MRLITVITASNIQIGPGKDKEKDGITSNNDEAGHVTGTVTGAGTGTGAGPGSVLDISKLPRFNAGGKIPMRVPSHPKGLTSAVVEMEFICNNTALLVIYANGLVTLTTTDFTESEEDMDEKKINITNVTRGINESKVDSSPSFTSSFAPSLCSTHTVIVPLTSTMKDENNGKLFIATCGTIESNYGPHKNDSIKNNLFGLVRGSIVEIYKVELSGHAGQGLDIGNFI